MVVLLMGSGDEEGLASLVVSGGTLGLPERSLGAVC